MNRLRPLILDISEHQSPSLIDYQQWVGVVDLVIVRIQYGSLRPDKHYVQHLTRLKQLGIPINVYAWVRGISELDMAKEADDYYQRASRFNPSVWWLDIEEQSMADMVRGCEVFRRRLKGLGATKVGAYIGNHLYRPFGFMSEDCQKYEGLWLPTYGQNNGHYQGANPTATRAYDVHQYTSQGRLPGYAGPLDFSWLASQKPLSYYTGEGQEDTKETYRVGERVLISGVYSSSASRVQLKPLRSQGIITSVLPNARNPYLLDQGSLGWVNEASIAGRVHHKRQYVVRQGETLSAIALKLGMSWPALASMNQLANPHVIYPGQVLVY